MSAAKPIPPKDEPTPVDDVRAIRQKLSDEAGNDVGRLADRAREKAEELRKKLGLRRADQRQLS